MSQKNSGKGHEAGVFMTGCAALLTALGTIGVFSYFKPTNQPVPPITTVSPTPVLEPSKSPSVESPPKDPALCPPKMTFGELDDFNNRNNLQAKDICDNQPIILTGYINTDGVQECVSKNDSSEPTKIRCLMVYHRDYNSNGGGYSNIFNATNEEEKLMFIDINKKLYQYGNHSIRIQATISFVKKGNTQVVDYNNLKILDYQPLNKK